MELYYAPGYDCNKVQNKESLYNGMGLGETKLHSPFKSVIEAIYSMKFLANTGNTHMIIYNEILHKYNIMTNLIFHYM